MTTMNDAKRVNRDVLGGFLFKLFSSLGMTGGNARTCADAVVLTNLWGIDSHGIVRLPTYARRLRENVINGNPKVRVLADSGALRILDGDEGMGFLVGHEAMHQAMEMAGAHGIGMASVRNSNHFGAASLYAWQAVKEGFMALVMSNVRPNMVAPGGAEPVTGNNPIAFGAPTRLGFPFLLDISMSTVAGGKFFLAQSREEKIPFGWATDKDGKPTDDPGKALEGFLLPIGGHKGFGLSLVVDLLCGVISGGTFQHRILSMYTSPDSTSGTCHMMLALDPGVLLGESAYLDRMDTFYRSIKSSPVRAESCMYLPGEIEHATMLRRESDGIPVHDELLREINCLACDLGVEALDTIDQTRAPRGPGRILNHR